MHTQLPIDSYEEEILKTIRSHRVVIISAETGTGKSTRVPQMLWREGYSVVVTQPRRIAARSLAERIAEEMECELGTLVGYQTGFEENFSDDTDILFCTDGLEMLRHLRKEFDADIYIFDEIHEWNLNQEILIAWAKRMLTENDTFRLILMSATIQTTELSTFFNGAPVIEVPSRIFPVREVHACNRPLTEIIKELVNKNHNVLVFQPGKADIAQTISELENDNVKAQLIPLHSELEPAEQKLVFNHYELPKVVVATNIAQTSITIDDIDAVVDTGLERYAETVDGIERWYIKPISLADRTQRKGRAGLTKEGVYYNCYNGNEPPSPYPKAKIQRHDLDQVVLRLALHDVDATELDFFHQPFKKSLVDARARLQTLGALDHKGALTPIGRRMATLPVNVRYARMIVEAETLGVLDDILIIVAILEVKGIVERNNHVWRKLTSEITSDLLAQLDIYKAAFTMKDNSQRRANGINTKSLFRAKEIRAKLAKTIFSQAQRSRTSVNFTSSGNRDDILKAITAGMLEHVYELVGKKCRGRDGITRKLSRDSVLYPFGTQIIIGEPIDIQINQSMTLNLITMASTVTLDMLQKVAGHLVDERLKGISLSSTGEVIFSYQITFNGLVTNKVRHVSYTWDQLDSYQPHGMGVEKVRQMLASPTSSES